MKKSFKIILVVSLVINLAFIIIGIASQFQRKQSWEHNVKLKYSHLTKTVNISETKKHFFDSLFNRYPDLKAKNYIFLTFWHTGDIWSRKQLPMLDTLITPLLPDVGYVLVSNEEFDYSKLVIRQDTSTINNFLLMPKSEDFMYAINQELHFPRNRFNYPHIPMNLILDARGKIVYFDTLEAFSGPKWPEDSLKDKIFVQTLNKALSELK